MTAPTLRSYQQECVAAIIAARRRGVRRLCVALPTGSGKTVIFSHLAAIARRPVLVLVHRRELVTQARDKLGAALRGPDGRGEAVVGIEQAGERASAEAKVIVASIRSLHENRLRRMLDGRAPGLVLYDECHHAVAEDNLRVLKHLGAFDADWKGTLIGFTATTARGDGQGLDAVFEQVVYSRSLQQMIEEKYLVPLRGYRVSTQADLVGLSRASGGDFAAEALESAVDVEDRNALVARSILELARDRRTIVFCVGVSHAQNLARALRHVGVRAAAVFGDMDKERRAEVLTDLKRGALQVVTNVGVLTEGFDDPGVSCVAMARPTRSQGLYAQCVGRGLRTSPGKKDCLVLDFVDLSDVELVALPTLFGMPSAVDLNGEEVVEAAAALKWLPFDLEDLELEAASLTLEEIKERAASFDPLTLRIDPEVAAISPFAWVSLGRRGVALHYENRPRHRSLFEILRTGGRYRVSNDGDEVARFGTVAEAVEAVDYEIRRRGARVVASAAADAEWRRAPVPEHMAIRLAELAPPRVAADVGAALHHLAFAAARKCKLRRDW